MRIKFSMRGFIKHLLLSILFVSPSFGWSTFCDGTDDYIDASGSGTTFAPTTSAFTVVGWFYAQTTVAQYGHLVTLKSGSVPFRIIYSSDASYNFSFGGSSTWGTFQVPLPTADAWHHLVLTYNGADPASSSSFNVYIDNVPKSITASGVFGAITNATSIGFASGGAAGQYFKGYLEEFAVYNNVISATERAQLWGNGTPKKYLPAEINRNSLMAYWSLDDFYSGQTASGTNATKDYSNNRNYGSPQNSPLGAVGFLAY